MASKTPINNLGNFLTKRKIANIDIHAKTSIATVELSKLRNGLIKKISAKKLVLIVLSINEDIEKVIKEIYPDISLKNVENEVGKTKLTSLGDFLGSVEANTLKTISSKTGISVTRLKILQTKETAIPLAHELYLIELATNQNPGSLFKRIYKDLELNSIELQNSLREKEKLKSSKLKK